MNKYAISGIAVLAMGFAVFSVTRHIPRPAQADPPALPPRTPFIDAIAGTGLVEASTENISVSTDVTGVVAKVLVKAGDAVKAGQALFVLDDRQARAEVAMQEANLRVAQAHLAKLKALPRREDVPVATARLAEAQAMAADAREQMARAESLQGSPALSREETQRRRNLAAAAAARAAEAKAALELLTAGAWQQDLAIAEAQVASAAALLNTARTQLERHTIQAPVEGEILQVNVRPGEYLNAVGRASPPLMMGNTHVLHVRVDIAEEDATRFDTSQAAVASPRGSSDSRHPLKFVRYEPYVIPKRNLTGDNTERVDTRVFQVIYRFEPDAERVFVGQQMDVFVQTGPATVALTPAMER